MITTRVMISTDSAFKTYFSQLLCPRCCVLTCEEVARHREYPDRAGMCPDNMRTSLHPLLIAPKGPRCAPAAGRWV